MNSGYMKDLLKDWKERAEKAEAELERVKALLSETEKQFGHQWEAASDKLMALIDTHKDLQAEAAEMREALECVESIVANWALDCGPNSQGDRDYKKLEHALSSSTGTGYVRADNIIPALEGALVICQCFADGQEASPGFMDNNANVIRIKDALAKVKGLPATSEKPSNKP